MPMVLVADPTLDRTSGLELHKRLADNEHPIRTVDAAEAMAARRLEIGSKAAIPSPDRQNLPVAGEPETDSRPEHRGHAAGL